MPNPNARRSRAAAASGHCRLGRCGCDGPVTASVVAQALAGGCLVGCAVLASGSGSAGLSRGEPGAPGGVADTQVRVLQMNLCDSGLAGCYTGRSVTAAAAVIRDQAPDLVTLNEVCRDDVSILERALAGSDQVGVTASAFQPARDRRTGASFRCRDGQPYGIGLVVRLPLPDRGFTQQHQEWDLPDPGRHRP